jgi:hypothetical protein
MAYAKWPIARQSPHGLARWGDYVFAINDDVDECDAWVVLEDLPRVESRRCPVGRTIFMGTEPPIHGRYDERFLSQFATVVTCGGHASGHPRHIHSFPPQPWFFGIDEDPSRSCTLLPGFSYWTLEQIAALEPKKSKLLSVVCSNKTHTAGHRRRYEFTRALKTHFGDALDWFGTGTNPIVDKAQALVDYKYHIAVENSAFPHYWTEKLADTYLGWALPIYWGCPNLNAYFPADSLAHVDPDDPAGAIQIIEKLIARSAWESSLEAIREARRRVIEEYNVFPLIVRLLSEAASQRAPATIRLRPRAHFDGRARTWLRRTRTRLQFGWGVTRLLPFLRRI